MPALTEPFDVLRGVLDRADLDFLRDACRARLDADGIPCFALIDQMQAATYLKIERALTERIGSTLNYLNDFYIYTDATFRTNWHMDTELFTFEHAINAWILLSPDQIENPLGFIHDVNDSPERHYHSVRIKGDECTFRNFRTGKGTVKSLTSIEEGRIDTPAINVGDILVINPERFHKTNVETPKHAFALKFVYGQNKGCLSPTQVPDRWWPEVKTFNDAVARSSSWSDMVEELRQQLKTDDGRTKLSSGFYPEKFGLYKKMVQTL